MKPQIFSADKEKDLAKELTLSTMDSQSLAIKNKVILITGATQGIGHTLALAATVAGAQTILLDKSIPALESLYDDVMALSESHSGLHEPFLLPIDMAGANLDDYLASAEALGKEITQLDGIIHNAAHFAGLYALLQTPPEDLIKQIHVNYTAPIWLTQAFFELLSQSKSPTLLFADHEESYLSDAAYWNTYAGSKLALMQAVRQLALENESTNLFAYGYNTGWVNTVLARQVYPHANPDWPQAQDARVACEILKLFDRREANGQIINLAERVSS